MLLIGLGAFAIALMALAVWIVLRARGTPEKREQRRRLYLHRMGRLGDALLTEANENTLYYTYTIRGVQYTASQDITALRDQLPVDPERLIGVTSMKYATNNPANSMLVCEEWTGLRHVGRASGVPKPLLPDLDRVGH